MTFRSTVKECVLLEERMDTAEIRILRDYCWSAFDMAELCGTGRRGI